MPEQIGCKGTTAQPRQPDRGSSHRLRYFYEYQPPRDLDEIDAELNAVEAEIAAMLAEVTE